MVMKTKTARDMFFSTIYEMIKNGEDIYLVTADLAAPSLDELRIKYPEHYISVGISEQNLVAVASGLALSGHKVIAYGLLPFVVTRAFDQIRCVMSELDIPITLCGLNCGLSSAEAGYTHVSIEDLGMLNMLPNIQTYTPSDISISGKIAEETMENNHPRVVRFDKAVNYQIYDETTEIVNGFHVYHVDNNGKILIISSGSHIKMLRHILDLYHKDNNSDLGLMDIFRVPFNESKFIEIIRRYEKVLVVEENSLHGGLSTRVLEILNDNSIHMQMVRNGIDTSKGWFDVYTDRQYIRSFNRIDKENIVMTIDTMLRGSII